jgi:hypothetical protein
MIVGRVPERPRDINTPMRSGVRVWCRTRASPGTLWSEDRTVVKGADGGHASAVPVRKDCKCGPGGISGSQGEARAVGSWPIIVPQAGHAQWLVNRRPWCIQRPSEKWVWIARGVADGLKSYSSTVIFGSGRVQCVPRYLHLAKLLDTVPNGPSYS